MNIMLDDQAKLAGIPTAQDPRWAAVVARDRAFDGNFYYSVETTGVYCRPSCAARLAKPENVRFHLTREDAERAGFRPCKRCKPDQPALIERHASEDRGDLPEHRLSRTGSDPATSWHGRRG